MATRNEIIHQLSELVAKLSVEKTMSSDAGPFQAPPPEGGEGKKIKNKMRLKPHVERIIQMRLRQIKTDTPVD